MFGSEKRAAQTEQIGGERGSDEDREKHTDGVAVLEAPASDDSHYGTTRRALKSRHIQLIALGGCIGTGLFVGTGSTVRFCAD